MSIHHGRLEDHYKQLLDAHATELPPLPAALAAERLEAEAALRRMHNNNPKVTMDPEPPPRLLPGAPKPKPSPVYRGPATARESTW